MGTIASWGPSSDLWYRCLLIVVTENNRVIHIRNAVAFSDFTLCCKDSAISSRQFPKIGHHITRFLDLSEIYKKQAQTGVAKKNNYGTQ